MLDSTIAKKYATGLYSLAKGKGMLTDFEAQLVTIKKDLTGVEGFDKAYMHPLVPDDAKKRIIKQAYEGEIDENLLSFLQLLVDKKREPYILQIIDEYIELVDVSRNMVRAEVTTAVQVSDGQLAKLTENLERFTGKSVRVALKVDERIMGGLVVRIGDKIIDNSIRSRLTRVSSRLRQTDLSR